MAEHISNIHIKILDHAYKTILYHPLKQALYERQLKMFKNIRRT